MVWRVVAGLCLAGVVSSGVPARAQQEEVDRLLETKPSPGVEALLLAYATDGRVGRRWIGLLSEPSPTMRLMAARALGVTNVKTAAPDLLKALAKEQALEVVAELVQSLAVVGSDDDVLQVHAHLHRLPDDRVLPLLDGLAAARPALMARHLLSADPLRSNAAWVAAAYARVAMASPAEADQIDAALTAAPDATVIEGVVRGAIAARRRLPPAIVNAGLRLSPFGRHATVTYLATVYGSPAKVLDDPALARAAPATPAPPDDAAEARWVAELERRWFGRDAGTRLDELVAELPPLNWIKETPRHVLTVLSADERAAFARHVGLAEAATEALIAAQPGELAPEVPPPALTLLTELPATMLAEVVRLTGCQPQAADERLGSVRYRVDRRPGSLAMEREGWSPGCYRAARAAVAMAYGPPPRGADDRTLVLVRLDPEFTACLADRQTGSAPAIVAGSEWGVAPPHKVHDRTPDYPEVAVRSRIQGVVGIEARIERTGCVSEARVVRSVHQMLDEPALEAVSRWRYAPTTLNGEPVPLVMTVDVTYSLR